MDPIFSFVQLFFHHPFLFFVLYIHLVIPVPMRSYMKMTNMKIFLSRWMKD